MVAKVLYNFHKKAINNIFDRLLLLKILFSKLIIFLSLAWKYRILILPNEKEHKIKTKCLLIYHILLHSVISW